MNQERKVYSPIVLGAYIFDKLDIEVPFTKFSLLLYIVNILISMVMLPEYLMRLGENT